MPSKKSGVEEAKFLNLQSISVLKIMLHISYISQQTWIIYDTSILAFPFFSVKMAAMNLET